MENRMTRSGRREENVCGWHAKQPLINSQLNGRSLAVRSRMGVRTTTSASSRQITIGSPGRKWAADLLPPVESDMMAVFISGGISCTVTQLHEALCGWQGPATSRLPTSPADKQTAQPTHTKRLSQKGLDRGAGRLVWYNVRTHRGQTYKANWCVKRAKPLVSLKMTLQVNLSCIGHSASGSVVGGRIFRLPKRKQSIALLARPIWSKTPLDSIMTQPRVRHENGAWA